MGGLPEEGTGVVGGGISDMVTEEKKRNVDEEER
ncbi:hypothetical protein A2U01_0104320, partial [Trifolium medium]|nr:hypothetical protein [Trifolium medium]